MFNKILFITLACFTCSCLRAQTLYNFKYIFGDDDDPEYYNAFMVRNDDGTGFIRVSFTNTHTGQKYLVEMDMEESYDIDGNPDNDDSSMLYFSGYDPVEISGDTSEYDRDVFVFQKKENSEFYEPLEVLSFDDDNNFTVGAFTESKLLQPEDITKEFLLQFFSRDDDFYKSFFEAKVRQITGDEKQATLHLILVANTNDAEIGNTCKLDKERTLKTYADIAEYLKIKFDPKTVSGDDYNIKNVENAITSTSVSSSKDIVIFYYTGHGFSKNDKYEYPYMDLRSRDFDLLKDNSLNIEDIFDRVKQKGPNLALVFSDCCNTLPETPSAMSADVAITRSSSIGWSLNNCSQLFLPTAPMAILVTAAKKGEFSAGNASYGGLFTANFRSSLLTLISAINNFTGISWQKLIDQAQTQTIKQAAGTTCNLGNGKFADCVQHPVYIIK